MQSIRTSLIVLLLIGCFAVTLNCGGEGTQEPAKEQTTNPEPSTNPEESTTAPEEKASVPEEQAVVPEEKATVPEEKVVTPEEKTPTPEETATPDGGNNEVLPEQPVQEEAVTEKPPVESTTEMAPEGSTSEMMPEMTTEVTPEVTPEGGTPEGTNPDVTIGNTPLASAANDIKSVRGGTAGFIRGAAVTYIKTKIGNDPQGFFLQATKTGPAIFVEADLAKLTPKLKVGDIITLKATTVNKALQGRAHITAFSDLKVHGNGFQVSTLAQDVSAAKDLVSALGDYESELIQLEGTVKGTYRNAGTGFISVGIETAGVKGSTALQLRVPGPNGNTPSLAAQLGLADGCTFTLSPTPMWRFSNNAQPSANEAKELKIKSCPSPKLVGAKALSATSVELTFTRPIDKQSVQPKGNDITFDQGLTSTAATVNLDKIIVTTSQQSPGKAYKVTIAKTVKDSLGKVLDPTTLTATFTGYSNPAKVVINEINANITSGCDLIELRVISDGSLDGFYLQERTSKLITFSKLSVKKNDIIVVHMGANSSTCNPAKAANETKSANEQPVSKVKTNYDTAYDWYSTDSGITSTDNVIALYDTTGKLVDAVFVTSKTSGTAASSTESEANKAGKAGQWKPVSGSAPAKGYIDDDFHKHAVQGLKKTGTKAADDSIQRKSDTDTNTLNDWGVAKATWGTLNVGQKKLP